MLLANYQRGVEKIKRICYHLLSIHTIKFILSMGAVCNSFPTKFSTKITHINIHELQEQANIESHRLGKRWFILVKQNFTFVRTGEHTYFQTEATVVAWIVWYWTLIHNICRISHISTISMMWLVLPEYEELRCSAITYSYRKSGVLVVWKSWTQIKQFGVFVAFQFKFWIPEHGNNKRSCAQFMGANLAKLDTDMHVERTVKGWIILQGPKI